MTDDGGPQLAADEAARIRERYERSLSWRMTKPMRRAGELIRRLRREGDRAGVPATAGATGDRGAAASPPSAEPAQDGFDWWLTHLYGDELSAIDAACAEPGPDAFAAFRGLDDGLWTVLLSREYTRYPNIRALLPGAPAPERQRQWNGTSGLELLTQSQDFYATARARFAEHGPKPLAGARVLDFGCGWGRLTRFFARDVGPGALCACDPVEAILEVCRATRVPATLARSDFMPERLPFDGPFDLAYSFSVFTHLSERVHEACLRALHAAIAPGGILIATVRPPSYLWRNPLIRDGLRSLGADPLAALAQPRYVFVPHPTDPDHPQLVGDEVDYGETVISIPYIRERWDDRFELLDLSLLTTDMFQVVATLRRR
jgi:SAM-dependent methyltransferase